jgi:SNF2 family DNA or RNA helicase
MYTKEPKEIYVEKLLVEKDKSYHIWGKIFSGDTIHDFWIPKGAIIKEKKKNEVNVDYSKYDNRPPLSHQKEAIEKLLENDKFILADDMGLGKTTSTVIASLESGAKKTLIICPASLKINWEREIRNYTDKKIYICEGKKYEDAEYVIINYDIIKNFHDTKIKENSHILKSNFDLVIIDEAHYVSNSQAQRTKLIMDITKSVKKLWLLTGTPMTSRPMNYYNILKLVDSTVSHNWQAYAIRYCGGYQFRVGNRKVWNVSGASNLEELRERTSSQILRRLKTEVLDLPDKIMTPVYLKLKSNLYEELMGEYYDWYTTRQEESKSLSIQFSKLTKVRQVIAEEKINSTIEIAENIIEQGKKVIIFSNFTEPLKKIYEHFGKKAVYLDGTTSKPARQKAVDDFQENDKIMVFCGNIKAAGVGLTLTAAEACIMNDLSFVPSDHSQAEDRAYRYGQKNNVSVFYPIFENTIEGAIYDILTNKKQIIGTVMGDIDGDYTDIVEQILNEINNR